MTVTAFGRGIEFLYKLGVYDVVLPFLLVFTLVYAFLEKSKVLGVETYYNDDGSKSWKASRRNLNAMVAFVTAFFVIASSQLVAVINKTLSHTLILLLLGFTFMLVAGSFYKEGDNDKGFELQEPWKTIFLIISFIAIILIFLNALGWLDKIYRWLTRVWSSEGVAALILVLLMVLFVWWIGKDPNAAAHESKSKE